MDAPQSRTNDALLRHAGALRALARGLLGEEHAAEDAVQDTWVRALERPPQRPDDREGESESVGWLRSVTRTVALNWRRTEKRRALREQRASRAESLSSTDEVVEKRQVLGSVIDAVLALEEPYQSVVVMRYYEDLPPREIAARRGVPVATVKSQLHRGLARLRTRLDDEAGGERRQWACALAATLGWQGGAALSASNEALNQVARRRDVVMIGKTIAVFGAVVLGTVAGTQWISEPEGVVEVRGGEALSLVEVGSAQESPERMELLEPLQTEAVRNAAAMDAGLEAGTDSAPALAGEFVVRGVVVDENDQPSANASIVIAPLGQPLNHWGKTDATGAFEVRWPASTERMDVAFSAFGGRVWSGLHRLNLEAGQAREMRVMVAQATHRNIPANALAALDGSELKQYLQLIQEHGAKNEFEVRTARLAPADYLARFRGLPQFNDGFYWEAQGSPNVHVGWVAEVERIALVEDVVAGGDRVKHVGSVRYKALLNRELTLQGEQLEGRINEGTTIVGNVYDALGAPVPSARVSASTPNGAFDTTSDDDGAFELRGIEPGAKVVLRAGGGSLGIASEARVVGEGEDVWNPVLDRGLEVRGRLTDPFGTPLANWDVELVPGSDGAPAYDTTATDADGTFAIPNAPGGQLRLQVRPPQVWLPMPTHTFANVTAGSSELLLEVPEAALQTGEVRVTVLDSAGEPAPDTEVRLWHVASGRGFVVPSSKEPGSFSESNLPLGAFELTAGSPDLGYAHFGTIWIASDQNDLGVYNLSAAQLTELSAPTSDPAVLLRQDQGIETVMGSWARSEAPSTIELPAGNYAWR